MRFKVLEFAVCSGLVVLVLAVVAGAALFVLFVGFLVIAFLMQTVFSVAMLLALFEEVLGFEFKASALIFGIAPVWRVPEEVAGPSLALPLLVLIDIGPAEAERGSRSLVLFGTTIIIIDIQFNKLKNYFVLETYHN